MSSVSLSFLYLCLFICLSILLCFILSIAGDCIRWINRALLRSAVQIFVRALSLIFCECVCVCVLVSLSFLFSTQHFVQRKSSPSSGDVSCTNWVNNHRLVGIVLSTNYNWSTFSFKLTEFRRKIDRLSRLLSENVSCEGKPSRSTN